TGARLILTLLSGAWTSLEPVKSPWSSVYSAITLYDEPARMPWSVKVPVWSVVARTTLPPVERPSASRTRTLDIGAPFSSTTRPEILASLVRRRPATLVSARTEEPGSPVTTGNCLSPTEATVWIFGETPPVLAQPARQREEIRRRGETLKVQ